MNIVADLIVIAMFAFFAYYGYRKGFIRAFFDLFGGLISFFVSSLLAHPVGSFISDKLLMPYLSSRLTQALSEQIANRASSVEIDEIVPLFSSVLKTFAIGPEEVRKMLGSVETSGEDWIRSAVDLAITPLIDSLGYLIALIFLSVLFFIVIRIVVKVFDLVFKLPILKIPNHVLGLVLGSCFGLFLSVLISYAFGVFEPFFQGSDLVFFRGFSVGKTVLVRFFNEFFLQLFF